MTFKIERSTINRLPFDYLKEVEAFRQALLAHRFTLDPAPNASELIDRAIRRVQTDGKPDDFIIDIEIIEDVTFDDRKNALLSTVHKARDSTLAAIISPGRERLMMLDISEIKPDEITPEQKAMVDSYNAIQIKKRAVIRYFTNAEIEVEELTEASIDGWTMKPEENL